MNLSPKRIRKRITKSEVKRRKGRIKNKEETTTIEIIPLNSNLLPIQLKPLFRVSTTLFIRVFSLILDFWSPGASLNRFYGTNTWERMECWNSERNWNFHRENIDVDIRFRKRLRGFKGRTWVYTRYKGTLSLELIRNSPCEQSLLAKVFFEIHCITDNSMVIQTSYTWCEIGSDSWLVTN